MATFLAAADKINRGNGRGRRGESVGVHRVAGDARTGQIEAAAAMLCSWGERERWVAGSVLGIAEKTRRGTSWVQRVKY